VPSFLALSLALVGLLAPQTPPPAAPQQPPAPAKPPQIPSMPADVQPVVKTKSGLEYCVLKAGEAGASPKFGDKVKVQYTGWNTDESVFDSSRVQNEPAEFQISNGIIEGWCEALQLMTPGAHWKLKVPPELGYGAQGNRGIKPNATLIFELELLSFEKGPDLPAFHAANPANQKKTESGLVYEALKESGGAAPKPDDLIEIRFAIWNPNGRLLDCTELYPKAPTIRRRAADMPIRVLQVAPQYMTVGSRYRFEAPADLLPNFGLFGRPYLPVGSVTVWEVELLSATPIVIPPFTKPDPDKQTATKSGLKYEVLKEGTGRQPKAGESVTVVYTGWLASDGTMFDSSLLRGDPMTCAVRTGPRGGVIAGWVEGLQLMKEGAVYRLEIPPTLAYGPRAMGTKIPPNSTLIFQIELTKVGAGQ
jgi:FKBP-type peptidyl-prolyl cis-trans isomerase